MNRIGRREWLAAGALAAAAPVLMQGSALAQESAATPAPAAAAAVSPAQGAVNEEQLGQMIEALGLKPDKKEQRYDFAFRATLEEQEWELSMSSVLSQDGTAVWVMAWLDECPKSKAEVPITALLRMLAENDKLGNGKFFAYIANNRRFVLQRSIENENFTSAKLRVILQDLGTSVVETYPIWAVANWNPAGTPAAPVSNAATPPAPAPERSAANDPKFEQPVRR